MSIKNVVLIGANGRLGPSVLEALLSTPIFSVSVLTRASSKSEYPATVRVLKTDDDLPKEQLVQALKSQDALVIAFSGVQIDNSIKLVDAAFEAGLKHIIPADYGSCDSSDPRSLDLVPLYRNKKVVRDHLIKLSKQQRSDGSYMSWTSIINGHFFDYGLKSGLLSVDLKHHTVRVYDQGDHVFATTTLATIGLATARILQMADHPRLKNQLVYIQSIATTQNDLIAALEKAIGHTFQLEHVKSEDFIKQYKSQLDKSLNEDGFVLELVQVEGIVNANWQATVGDASVNDLLCIPKAHLLRLVQAALE